MKRAQLVVLLGLLFTWSLHYDLAQRFRVNRASLLTPLQYLPSGKYLKHATFGYEGLIADYVYLWSIQYYGDASITPQVEYLQHTYDLITELDPYYMDAYQTGALFMFHEGRNPEAGLRLLESGLKKNPEAWILPMDAGFYCAMYLKDYKRALNYFVIAADVPSAPPVVKRLTAGMYFRLGDKRHALSMWQEVYDSSEDPWVKQTAFQHIHDLKVLIDLDTLRKAVENFRSATGRNPANLAHLQSAGFLKAIPLDPEEDPYEYDPAAGTVKYSKNLIAYKRYQ